MQTCKNGDENVPLAIWFGITDGIIHILVGIIVGILATKFKFKNIIFLSVISEIIIDSSHLINKAITHNIFFLLEFPLFMILFAYVFNIKRFRDVSMGIQSIFLSHFILDTIGEGDNIMLFYPFSSQLYMWNGQHSFLIIIPLLIVYGLANRKYLTYQFKIYLQGFKIPYLVSHH